MSYISYTKGDSMARSTTNIAYAALDEAPVAETPNVIVEEDSKVEIVRQFLVKYNSPLTEYAPDLVVASERYDLDFRLLPAIAMQESNLCKRVPVNSHNCWGWGIYGGKVTRFNNYPEAIETISKTLSVKYREKHGLVTPHEVGRLYNPNNTNNWAGNVEMFMNQLK